MIGESYRLAPLPLDQMDQYCNWSPYIDGFVLTGDLRNGFVWLAEIDPGSLVTSVTYVPDAVVFGRPEGQEAPLDGLGGGERADTEGDTAGAICLAEDLAAIIGGRLGHLGHRPRALQVAAGRYV